MSISVGYLHPKVGEGEVPPQDRLHSFVGARDRRSRPPKLPGTDPERDSETGTKELIRTHKNTEGVRWEVEKRTASLC